MVTNAVAGRQTLSRLGKQAELRHRYDAYRRRQAARLVHLMPTEAVRPLYRRAHAAEIAEHPEASLDDPLGLLIRFCETLLPLPPFEVWKADLEAHPNEHLRDLDESAQAPTVDAPSTVAVRSLTYRDATWRAHLRSFRDRGVWRGYIAFEEGVSGRVHRTATVFRETDPAELRERFILFENVALEAFLRSALP